MCRKIEEAWKVLRTKQGLNNFTYLLICGDTNGVPTAYGNIDDPDDL